MTECEYGAVARDTLRSSFGAPARGSNLLAKNLSDWTTFDVTISGTCRAFMLNEDLA